MFSFYCSLLSITFLNTTEMWSKSLGSILLIMGRKFGETNMLEKGGLTWKCRKNNGICHTSSDLKMPWIVWGKHFWLIFDIPNFRDVKMEKKGGGSMYYNCWKHSFSEFKGCSWLDALPLLVDFEQGPLGSLSNHIQLIILLPI